MAAVRRQKDEDAAEASPAAPSKKLKTLVATADESRYKVGVAYTQAALDAYTAVLRENEQHAIALLYASQHMRGIAASQADLDESERHLRKAIASANDDGSPFRGRRKEMREQLVLFLLQEGRDGDALKYLRLLKCKYRLSREVLQYDIPPPGAPPPPAENCSARYCRAVDGALPAEMLAHLKRAFEPSSPFWSEHGYNEETSGYFSYVHRLNEESASGLEQIFRHLQSLVADFNPAVMEAQWVEWWAHCRLHCSGHQLHFDSDNEGQGGVRNPVVSTVTYLSEEPIGGPTLVTDQLLTSHGLAEKGWLIFPKYNRVGMFDARYLHGVIPGRSFSPSPGGRRVTFMVAFWRDIEPRSSPDGSQGAARLFPDPKTSKQKWPALLAGNLRPDWSPSAHAPLGLAGGIPLPRVWADVDPEQNARDGCSLAGLGALPQYSACFQGF